MSPPPGTVELRFSGELADVEALAEEVGARYRVTSRRGPYPNRNDPGFRVYLQAGASHRA